MIKTVFLLSTLCTVVYSYDIKVLDTVNSDERGLEPCIRQCLGTSGSSTAWLGNGDKAYVYFDTSDCGFNPGTYPLISTTLVQDVSYYTVDVGVHKISSTSYRVQVTLPDRYKAGNILEHTKKYKWRVDWVATGYTCY